MRNLFALGAKAIAVPNAYYSIDNGKKLPKDVFKCSKIIPVVADPKKEE